MAKGWAAGWALFGLGCAAGGLTGMLAGAGMEGAGSGGFLTGAGCRLLSSDPGSRFLSEAAHDAVEIRQQRDSERRRQEYFGLARQPLAPVRPTDDDVDQGGRP